MSTLSFPKWLLRDPGQSEICLFRIDPAPDCDGLGCLGREDSYSALHWHLVVSGQMPDAGARHYPIE